MQAVMLREFGNSEALRLEDVPDPVPAAGEVLIRIEAVTVNFVDQLVIGGSYQFLPPLPFTPGKLPAGVVVGRGPGVTDIAVGDRVLTLAESGGYAQQIAVPAGSCYRIPDSIPFVEAASMALAYDTAWFALRERARCQPGETALILGASGGVGLAAVQLAKAFGMKVLGGISSPEKADLLRRTGIDATIDLSAAGLRDSLREQVRDTNGGNGADIVLDMLGGDYFDAAIRALAWRGRLVVVGFAAGRIPTLKVNYLLLKNIEVSGLQVSDYRKRSPLQMKQCFEDIFALRQAGTIEPSPATLLPLNRYAQALEMVASRRASGRVVLCPQS